LISEYFFFLHSKMDNQRHKNNFFDNHEDILLLVFSFLKPNQLATSCLVNKRWDFVIKERLLLEISSVKNSLRNYVHTIPTPVVFQLLKLKKKDMKATEDLLREYLTFREEEFSKFSDPSLVIAAEFQTRKAFWWQTDKMGRPCLIIRPKFHIPNKKNYTLLYAVHMFEKACDIVWKLSGVHDFCVIVDFEGFSTKNFDLHFARTFVAWSRKYFKNLLGACYCIRCPKYALLCWAIVKMFVPGETLKKIAICKDREDAKKVLLEKFTPEKLPMTYGGICQLPSRYLM